MGIQGPDPLHSIDVTCIKLSDDFRYLGSLIRDSKRDIKVKKANLASHLSLSSIRAPPLDPTEGLKRPPDPFEIIGLIPKLDCL